MPLIICAISSLASWGKPHAETVCMLGAPANDSQNSPFSTHIRHKFKAEAGSSALATRFYQLVQTVFSNRLRLLFNPTRVKCCSDCMLTFLHTNYSFCFCLVCILSMYISVCKKYPDLPEYCIPQCVYISTLSHLQCDEIEIVVSVQVC